MNVQSYLNIHYMHKQCITKIIKKTMHNSLSSVQVRLDMEGHILFSINIKL